MNITINIPDNRINSFVESLREAPNVHLRNVADQIDDHIYTKAILQKIKGILLLGENCEQGSVYEKITLIKNLRKTFQPEFMREIFGEDLFEGEGQYISLTDSKNFVEKFFLDD